MNQHAAWLIQLLGRISAFHIHTKKSSNILETAACALIVAIIVVADRGILTAGRVIRTFVAGHAEGTKRIPLLKRKRADTTDTVVRGETGGRNGYRC